MQTHYTYKCALMFHFPLPALPLLILPHGLSLSRHPSVSRVCGLNMVMFGVFLILSGAEGKKTEEEREVGGVAIQ